MAKRIFQIYLTLFCILKTIFCQRHLLKIAGYFEDTHRGAKLAFENGIDHVNFKGQFPELLIQHLVEYIPYDSLETHKRVCRDVREGVVAVVGPFTPQLSSHVESVCTNLHVPHIMLSWDPREIHPHFSVNLHPEYRALSRAYGDFIAYNNWTSFFVLYENDQGLVRLQDVLLHNKGYHVTFRRLDPDENMIIKMFEDLKDNRAEFNRYIVDCNASKVYSVLKKAQEVNMVTETFHYVFTTLDLSLVKLDEFKHSGANITAFRLINQESSLLQEVKEDWMADELNKLPSPLMGKWNISTEVALAYDAAYLFARAYHAASMETRILPSNVSCRNTDYWADGRRFLSYIKMQEFDGISGKIKFEDGRRTEFKLDILELDRDGLDKIGTWHPMEGVNITRTRKEARQKILQDLETKTLRVVTVKDEPLVIINEDGEVPKYEGFCIDILERIAASLKFNYTIYHAESYGNCNETGCSGMVNELVERRADLAVAGMTITLDRERVMDFTKPFLNLGITILFTKPKPEPPSLFSFFSPLSIDVWGGLLTGYLCFSCVYFIIARLSPEEWCNPHPCNPGAPTVENQFSLPNTMWFFVGCLMQQGSELAPRAMSTRVTAACWWFFTLIIVSSYTANLAAFLTIERMVSDINSAEDLANQNLVKYGTLNEGSTKKFFQHSQFQIYQRMWNTMINQDPPVFVNSSKQGIQRVKKGNYAYFAESPVVEYKVERECDLMQIGGLLDSKGYGIGLQSGSPYREPISNEILRLQETQEIKKLHKHWWKDKAAGKCSDDSKNMKTRPLTMKNVGGLFLVLVGGLLVGFALSTMEFLWTVRRKAAKHKRPLWEEIRKELRFAVHCFDSSPRIISTENIKEEIPENGVAAISSQSTDNIDIEGFSQIKRHCNT